MFNIIERYKKAHEFSAENCRRKQRSAENTMFDRKIADIVARINFVTETSMDEHAVIYRVRENDYVLYENIAEWFSNRGFRTVITKIDGLDSRYLIISW